MSSRLTAVIGLCQLGVIRKGMDLAEAVHNRHYHRCRRRRRRRHHAERQASDRPDTEEGSGPMARTHILARTQQQPICQIAKGAKCRPRALTHRAPSAGPGTARKVLTPRGRSTQGQPGRSRARRLPERLKVHAPQDDRLCNLQLGSELDLGLVGIGFSRTFKWRERITFLERF